MKLSNSAAAVVSDAAKTCFGDSRLSNRLCVMVEELLDEPACSFPDAFDDDELEGAYRFLRNKRVTPDGILAPHYDAALLRMAKASDVLLIHDTTEFRFVGEREGLGLLGAQKGQGFFAHMALAVSSETHREPYGVIGLATHVREARRGERKESDRRDPERESQRWKEMVVTVDGRLNGKKAIHVMDREADLFELFQHIIATDGRFVIRARHDRLLVDEDGVAAGETLFTRIVREEPSLQRTASLTARVLKRPTANGALPERGKRLATLDVSAVRVRLRAPKRFSGEEEFLDVNAVLVAEVNVPEGEAPVVWRLLTNEPIATAADIEKVVDAYRGRWVIEEYFKALKTGCAVEQRQLMTYRGLVNALALFIPIAWHLLLLRTTARLRPTASASTFLTDTQLAVLAKAKRARLPPNPTVHDALIGIARWGGFQLSNGTPGWMVINRGFEKLLAAEEGYRMAMM